MWHRVYRAANLLPTSISLSGLAPRNFCRPRREVAFRLEQRKQPAGLHQAPERLGQRLRVEYRPGALISHLIIIERHFRYVALFERRADAATLERRETEVHAVAQKQTVDRLRDQARELQIPQRARGGATRPHAEIAPADQDVAGRYLI